mmetsp:Transcript_22416/g.21552  ORF Transcript_22416/g.21552 Transcript_22416/m.21552 type:complete len:97 (+) Transcript_22416:537-827(+)
MRPKIPTTTTAARARSRDTGGKGSSINNNALKHTDPFAKYSNGRYESRASVDAKTKLFPNRLVELIIKKYTDNCSKPCEMLKKAYLNAFTLLFISD